MGLKDVSIDEVLYYKVKEYARKKGVSIRQATEEMILAYLSGDQGDPKSVSEWKQIAVKYPTTCVFCGKPINRGEVAMWAKGVGVAHLGCYYEKVLNSTGDKTIAKKYLKIKELEHTIKGLKQQADELANVVLRYEVIKQVNEWGDRMLKFANNFVQYIREYGNPEDIEKALELSEEVKKLIALSNSILRKLGILDKNKVKVYV
ncbi:hypothetical protein J7M00_06860 [bacterium]|nr:hypothetical protein [bacterium]